MNAAMDKRRNNILARLRRLCLKMEGVSAAASFGNPAFRAGKKQRPFVVLDHYKGADCLWLKVDPFRRDELLADPRFFASPYDPRAEALCRTLSRLNWRQLESLVRDSYRIVINKK